MTGDASNHERGTARTGKRSKVPPAIALRTRSRGVEPAAVGPAPGEVGQPFVDTGRESAKLGWAKTAPPELSDAVRAPNSATYRIVLSCVLDRRESGPSA